MGIKVFWYVWFWGIVEKRFVFWVSLEFDGLVGYFNMCIKVVCRFRGEVIIFVLSLRFCISFGYFKWNLEGSVMDRSGKCFFSFFWIVDWNFFVFVLWFFMIIKIVLFKNLDLCMVWKNVIKFLVVDLSGMIDLWWYKLFMKVNLNLSVWG